MTPEEMAYADAGWTDAKADLPMRALTFAPNLNRAYLAGYLAGTGNTNAWSEYGFGQPHGLWKGI